jgi:ferredoxin-NADP reductase
MDDTTTVVAVSEVGPDTIAIELDTPAGFSARPGQFVRLGATVDGETVRRFYTLSSPDAADTLEVTVGLDPDGGPFSAHLAAIEPGAELEVAGPFGDAAYDGEPRAVVLAGGPGVGAAVGIAERALAEGAAVAIVYRDDEPAHVDRLEAVREAGGEVWIAGTDDPLADPVADALTGADGETVFVYGFQAFVEEAEAAIEAAGGDPDAAKVESFG